MWHFHCFASSLFVVGRLSGRIGRKEKPTCLPLARSAARSLGPEDTRTRDDLANKHLRQVHSGLKDPPSLLRLFCMALLRPLCMALF